MKIWVLSDTGEDVGNRTSICCKILAPPSVVSRLREHSSRGTATPETNLLHRNSHAWDCPRIIKAQKEGSLKIEFQLFQLDPTNSIIAETVEITSNVQP